MAALLLAALPGSHASAQPADWRTVLEAADKVSHQGNAFSGSIERGQDSALALGRRALELARQAEGERSAAAGKVLNRLGDYALILGDRDQAEQFWTEAFTINNEALKGRGFEFEGSLHRLGILYSSGPSVEPTSPHADLVRRALDYRALVMSESDPAFAKPLYDLAELSGSLQRWDEYLSLITRVWERWEENRSADPRWAIRALVYLAEWQSKGECSNVAMEIRQQDSALALGKRALAIAEEYIGPEDTLTAFVANRLGDYYDRKGDYRHMAELWERAYRINIAAFPPEHIEYQGSIVRMAGLCWATGRYAEAEPLYREAVRLREMTQGPGHPETAGMYMSLGRLYLTVSNYEKAEQAFRKALAIREAAVESVPSDVASSLLYLGRVSFNRGDYAEAEERFLRALAIREQALGTNHALTATCMEDLARLYLAWGRVDEAERMLIQALASTRGFRGADHPDVATRLEALAAFYRETGRLVAARQALNDALANRTQQPEWHQDEIAHDLVELAQVDLAEGHFAEAEAGVLSSLEISERKYGKDDVHLIEPLSALASVYAGEGRVDAAAATYERLLGSSTAKRFPTLPNLVEAYDGYGSLLQTEGHDHEAMERFDSALQLRLRYFRDGAAVMSERDALRYAHQLQAARDRCLSAFFAARSGGLNRERPVRCVFASKGAVTEIMSERSALARRSRDAHLGGLVDSLRFVQSTLARVYVDTEESEESGLREERLRKLSTVCDSLERRIARASRSFDDGEWFREYRVNEVASALPPNSVLVEYLQYARTDFDSATAASHYLVFCLDTSGVIGLYDLGAATAIDSSVGRYRAHLLKIASGGGFPEAEDLSEYRRIAGRLYSQVWAPVAELLPDSVTVIVAPDGALNLVSFGALPVENGRYLEELRPVHYVSTGTDLIRLHARPDLAHGLLALGDPDFDRQPEAWAMAGGAATTDQIRSAAADCDFALTARAQRLPGSRGEVDRVVRAWRARRKEPTLELLGSEATERALKSHAPGNRVVHIATHGYYAADTCRLPTSAPGTRDGNRQRVGVSPLLLSGLLLAGANLRGSVAPADRPEDGVLTAEEVSGMNLAGTQLVVLSACESGVGDVQCGEGVYGLRRAFQLAGVRTILSTLWPVSDAASTKFMASLYGTSGPDLPSVLRAAALDRLTDMRQRGQPDHPFEWGAFIAIGDWRGIE